MSRIRTGLTVLARIREDGVFDNLGKTKAQVKLDDANRTADVTLSFAGR